MASQPDLFADAATSAAPFPEGFRYQANIISVDEQSALLADIRTLPFKEFEFHGYAGKRRIVSFGWKYDYDARRLEKREDIPRFLLPLRATAAAFAGLEATTLRQALVTEYEAGAPIGWHRDKAAFDEIIGISLLAPCTFRLRRAIGKKWERVSLIAEPRSAYLMSGPSRTEWEHSIPPVEALRYSVTFRNLRSA